MITSNWAQKITIANFAFNALILTYILAQNYIKWRKFSQIQIITKTIIKMFRLMPYIYLIQIIHVNSLVMQSSSKIIWILAIFNITFAIGQIFVIKQTDRSYRFQDQNLLKRKNNTIILWLLIVLIISSSNLIGPSFTCLLLCIRSFYQLYVNFYSLENQFLRKLGFFYPLLTFSISITFIAKQAFNISAFDTFFHAFLVLSLAIYTSLCFSQTLMIWSLNYHLKRSDHLFQLQTESKTQQSSENEEKKLSKSQIERYLLLVRILVNIFLSRRTLIKSSSLHNKLEHISADSSNYNTWWRVFNRSILNHKVSCIDVACVCRKFKTLSRENKNIQDQIFLKTISTLIKTLFNGSYSNSYDIQIIQMYFMIEFQNKPLKAYYELIRLYQEKLNLEEKLEVESLIKETKNNFEQVFLAEKVQNQHLDIEPILQFEQKIKEMKSDMVLITMHYKKFYEIFTKTFVEIDILKMSTKTLTQLKGLMSLKIDQFMLRFNRNSEFLSMCHIFYKFIDEYSDKMKKVQQKTDQLIMYALNPSIQIKNKIDIFDPFYGAVKIDLVFKVGKIISITKNICELLKYKRQELVGHNVNKMMPFIFARYHGKFLTKFIQDGTFNVLKKKQRIFYAKNAQKFIVPITARLKVDYLSNDNFSACSLINKLKTKSEFIMLNNHGKIEEISENIYRMLFGHIFIDEVGKVKRLSIYKMLLSLNFILRDMSEAQNSVYDGIIMTSESQKMFQSVFKAPETSRYFKGEQFTDSINGSSKMRLSMNETFKMQNDNSFDNQKIFNDLKESFKDFAQVLKLNEVRAYRINFKFYEIPTSEFKCKMVEILSIKEELTEEMIENEISQEVVQVGQLYDLCQQDTQTFRTCTEMSQKNIKDQTRDHQRSGTQTSRTKSRHSTFLFNPVEINSVENFIAFGQFNQVDNFCASQGSSFKQQNTELRMKQSLIAAFEKKDFINQKAQIAMFVLLVLLSLTFAVVCIFAMGLEQQYRDIKADNSVIASLRLNIDYRLAFQEVSHVFRHMGWPQPDFISTKNNVLAKDISSILKSSITQINRQLSSQLYFDYIQLSDYAFHPVITQIRQMLFTLNKISSIFLMSHQQSQFLSDNYIEINSNLNQIEEKEKMIIMMKSENLRNKIHIVVGVYFFLIVCLSLVFQWANKESIKREEIVVNFLPFVSAREAVKKQRFYETVYEYMKENQTFSLAAIQSWSDQFQLKQLKSNQPFYSNPTSDIKASDNVISQSKLLQIVKSNKKMFTPKNTAIMIFILVLCVSVVLYAEIFFSVAHERFKAFITLKDATSIMENMPARLIFLHFSNIDNLLEGQPINEYPQEFYSLAHDQRFKFRMNLSSVDFYGSDMTQLIDRHMSLNICLISGCPKNTTSTLSKQMSYLSNRIKNVFEYMRLIKQTLSQASDVETKLQKWYKQNKVQSLIQATDNILDLVKMSLREMTELFDSQIELIGQLVFYISLFLIPILMIAVAFIRKKFIEFVSQRIEVTENICKHFSWSILSANSYAVNYFQSKVKTSKLS